MSKTCAFCGHDPYHYEHNGLGYEAVAVTCCEMGCIVYGRHGDDKDVTVTVGELRELAGKIANLKWDQHRRNSVIEKLWDRRHR